MFQKDTIAAIATAMTSAGIGIIRVSGPDAVDICDRVYRGKQRLSEVESHTVHYGHIVWEDDVIDEVMVLVLRAPRTYTREDTVEIDCHGGILVMEKILEAVLRSGARPAEPGEFTKRAFLNGTNRSVSGGVSYGCDFFQQRLCFEKFHASAERYAFRSDQGYAGENSL